MRSLADPSEDREQLYTVLNLPRTASQDEVRDRYRSLSVLFHPDKQRDQGAKQAANRAFLDVQKAYDVLSDPFLRKVYDELGPDALDIKWPPSARELTDEQLQQVFGKFRIARSDPTTSKGRITAGLDLSPLFARIPPNNHLLLDLSRWREVQVTTFGVRHSLRRKVGEGDKTQLVLTGRMQTPSSDSVKVVGDMIGTVKHQFSPSLACQVSSSLLRPRSLVFQATHTSPGSVFTLQSPLNPRILRNTLLGISPPPLQASYTCALTKSGSTQGTLAARLSPVPSLTLSVAQPRAFYPPTFRKHEHRIRSPREGEGEGKGAGSGQRQDDESPDEVEALRTLPSSLFTLGTRQTSYGLTLAGPATHLFTSFAVNFFEPGLRLACNLQCFLVGGVLASATVGWSNRDESAGVECGLGWGADGTAVRVEVNYHEHHLVVPISLSQNPDPALGLFAMVLPAVLGVVGYHVLLKPARRKRRIEMIRRARAVAASERLETRRQSSDTAHVLRDVARRHAEAEKARDGLVILDAKYGPVPSLGVGAPELEDEIATSAELELDVTVPLQALVHNSQLYIPGSRSKVGLQGFYDPLPFFPKSLRVRYLFGGREHYAELADDSAVVFPLEEHAVERLGEL